ncbi:MAG: Gfo/Idh/MocA family oxidoreductase [Candidatus Hydrogenedentes bacterium]|nr:Gfo/Idh/MocA family oxidoreductase [Candidatus Hydrogenedentota bacterium]
MANKLNFTRREFLRTVGVASVAASGVPMIIPSSAFGAAGHVAPSNRVAIGCIGVGDRAMQILRATLPLPEAQVVAVCDVKRDRRDFAQNFIDETYGGKGCAAYNEFEELVGRNDIDACIIASCDHWHVLHALAATRAGKHVYVEKPLGISIEQNQTLRAAVKKQGTVFQFGTQQRSDAKFRKACELVLSGRIGKLRSINVWAPPSAAGGSLEPAPVPPTLDYVRWLGPAPFTPYTQERDSNKWWWFISDYAIGFIAGWGIHPIDIAVWGGGDLLQTPVTIRGKGTFPNEGLCNTAIQWDIACKYDSGVKLRYWSDPPPEKWKKRYGKVTSHGTAFEGSKGWVHVDREHLRTHPEKLAKSEIGPNELHLPVSDHHVQNFLQSILARKPAISDIESSVQSDILCQISDIAIRLDRKVRWDPAAERFVKDEEADARLSRPMRSPWQL